MFDWFHCHSGVSQGCNLSPTLFSVFANDLHLGITMGDVSVSILMYADDIVLVSDTENNLQTMRNTT